uniref:Uncharacterized protein n=1 Tax=Arundo donax TaxID=35708 RepID=A0A0A9HFV8_ARUDO
MIGAFTQNDNCFYEFQNPNGECFPTNTNINMTRVLYELQNSDAKSFPKIQIST